MSAITQAQHARMKFVLNKWIQRLDALGQDPPWSAKTSVNPALNYNVIRTEMAAEGVEVNALLTTWMT